MTAAKRHDAEAKIKIAKMTKKIREDERQAEAAREYARSLKQNTKENVGIMSVKKENDESLDIKIHSYKLYSGQRFAAASRMIDMYDQNKFKKLYGNKLKDKNAVELLNDFMIFILFESFFIFASDFVSVICCSIKAISSSKSISISSVLTASAPIPALNSSP